jgi:hypothetical protein
VPPHDDHRAARAGEQLLQALHRDVDIGPESVQERIEIGIVFPVKGNQPRPVSIFIL